MLLKLQLAGNYPERMSKLLGILELFLILCSWLLLSGRWGNHFGYFGWDWDVQTCLFLVNEDPKPTSIIFSYHFWHFYCQSLHLNSTEIFLHHLGTIDRALKYVEEVTREHFLIKEVPRSLQTTKHLQAALGWPATGEGKGTRQSTRQHRTRAILISQDPWGMKENSPKI